jgi:hypothetical protein
LPRFFGFTFVARSCGRSPALGFVVPSGSGSVFGSVVVVVVSRGGGGVCAAASA